MVEEVEKVAVAMGLKNVSNFDAIFVTSPELRNFCFKIDIFCFKIDIFCLHF